MSLQLQLRCQRLSLRAQISNQIINYYLANISFLSYHSLALRLVIKLSLLLLANDHYVSLTNRVFPDDLVLAPPWTESALCHGVA